MDKNQKKRIKKYVSWICVVALVAFLAVMPLMADTDEKASGPQASILEGTAELRDIQTNLLGGGTLTAKTAEELTIPASVKLTGFLVSNGDTVQAGDAIASVDRVSVMTAISEVQETLDYLAEQIKEAGDDSVSESVTARAGGTVKAIYAAEGDSVQDVMLEHGALAVLSLDGLMAVTLEQDSDVAAGDSVVVTFSDETEAAGRVESNLDGIIVVTVSDDDYEVGETVSVTTEDGTRLGRGTLYIHSMWNAAAYSGTVADIKVSVEDEVSAGKTLMKLEDTGYTARYQQLSSQRREYEELMMDLFQMYQSTTVTAPCNGVVSGIDENSAQLLASDGETWTLSFLTNSPTGEEKETYVNYIGSVFAVAGDGLIMSMNQQELAVTDYANIPQEYLNGEVMNTSVVYSDDAPIYERSEAGEWVQIAAEDIVETDILLFTFDAESNVVWVIRVQHEETPEETPVEPTQPETPAEPEQPTESTSPSEPEDSAEPTQPETPSAPSGTDTAGNGTSGMQQGTASYPSISGSMAGSTFQGGYPTEEETYSLYSLETVTIASVIAQEEMTLGISVDELDIARIAVGQEVTVTVDALGREIFTGTITDIGNTGTSNGGNSKFTVEVILPRGENMLSGMNAAVTVPLDIASDVLTIPEAALVENGTKITVFTGCDENGNLTDPVEVTLGVSDGEYVQVLSGLNAGDTFYYAYYDTLEISNGVESGRPF